MVFDSFDIKSLIRPVIDVPKPGVIFRDITPLFQSPINSIAAQYS